MPPNEPDVDTIARPEGSAGEIVKEDGAFAHSVGEMDNTAIPLAKTYACSG